MGTRSCKEIGWNLMSGIFLGVKGRPVRRADKFTAICEPNIYKMWERQRLTALWASTA
jgi:hypothetical protein